MRTATRGQQPTHIDLSDLHLGVSLTGQLLASSAGSLVEADASIPHQPAVRIHQITQARTAGYPMAPEDAIELSLALEQALRAPVDKLGHFSVSSASPTGPANTSAAAVVIADIHAFDGSVSINLAGTSMIIIPRNPRAVAALAQLLTIAATNLRSAVR